MATFAKRTTCSLLALAIAGIAGQAWAQDPVAPAIPAGGQGTASATAPAVTEQSDIIVTATKRRERIEDVALPISAITGEQLARSNANSLGDYIARLPGVVFNDYQPGVSEVVIRGIAATTYHEQGQTTVGYYLNEVQVVEPGFPIVIPDVDTFDLNRVEVLRGPQGTLFGSSTLGGLVNYIVNVADPTKIDAAAQGLIGSTKNADGGLNHAGKVMVNVPIIQDRLAVRLTALQRFDAGYLDNPGIDRKGTNDLRTRGLRGSVVFTPAEGTRVTYLSTYQDSRLDDQTYLDLANPYIRNLPRAETQYTRFLLNSLRVDQDVGFATATVLGSVDSKRNRTLFSYPYGYVTGITTGPDAAYAPGRARANIKTIEGRLASTDADAAFRWLIGVSYLHARKNSYDTILAPGAEAFIDANPDDFGGLSGAVLAPGDRIYGYLSDSLNEDFGVFGEATWRPVRALEITAGGRYYRTRARADVTNQAGFVSGSTTDLSGSVDQKDHGFTPKATIAVHPAANLLAYATYSEGYRVGGINPNAGLLASIPTSYAADKVRNYEAGIKTQLFRRRLIVEASVFNIDWRNIQARLFGPAPQFFSFVTNASAASIAGVEFSGTVKPVRALTVSSNVTYQDAHLTQFLPDTFAVGGGYAAGTRLPGSSEWSVANTATLDLPVRFQPSLEVAHRYLSKAPVAFGNPSTRGGFNVFDVRLAVNPLPKIRLLGFVNNVFDTFGVLNAPFTSQLVPAGSIIRPRTYGLRVDWTL